jgi:hypothetical protein
LVPEYSGTKSLYFQFVVVWIGCILNEMVLKRKLGSMFNYPARQNLPARVDPYHGAVSFQMALKPNTALITPSKLEQDAVAKPSSP